MREHFRDRAAALWLFIDQRSAVGNGTADWAWSVIPILRDGVVRWHLALVAATRHSARDQVWTFELRLDLYKAFANFAKACVDGIELAFNSTESPVVLQQSPNDSSQQRERTQKNGNRR